MLHTFRNKFRIIFVLIAFIALLHTPDIYKFLSHNLDNIFSNNSLNNTQLAAVTSAQDLGQTLGNVVHDVVRNIKAQHPNSKITHAHVLAIMCQELPSLQIGSSNSEGRNEGLTQVITSTYLGLISGKVAEGKCRYTANLENGQCANLSARTTNARCSVEVGSCFFDYWLTRCNGNAACAYNAYNTGSPNKRANGASDFAKGYNNLIQGNACAKSAHNPSVWSHIMSTVSRLTGGLFKTDEAVHIAISANNLKNEGMFAGLSTGGNSSLETSNPLAQFLGLQPSATAQPSSSGGNGSNSKDTYNSGIVTTNQTTSKDPDDLGAVDFLTLTSAPAITSDTQKKSDSVTGATPTLLCLPSPLNQGEEAMIFWACRDQSYKTTSENFDTEEKLIGSTRVTPEHDTTYTVTCENEDDIDNTAASCMIDVIDPVLALIATPHSVTRGGTVSLSWTTKDVASCVLSSADHESFTRNGIAGDVLSPALNETTTFVLTCESATGALEEKTIDVQVQ